MYYHSHKVLLCWILIVVTCYFHFSTIMEDNTHQGSAQQDSSEVPSLINYISSNAVVSFDDIKQASFRNDQCQTSKTESLGPSTNVWPIILCLLNRNWHFLIHVSRMISKGPECLNKHVHIIYYYSEIFSVALQDLLCGSVSMFVLLLTHRKIKKHITIM